MATRCRRSGLGTDKSIRATGHDAACTKEAQFSLYGTLSATDCFGSTFSIFTVAIRFLSISVIVKRRPACSVNSPV